MNLQDIYTNAKSQFQALPTDRQGQVMGFLSCLVLVFSAYLFGVFEPRDQIVVMTARKALTARSEIQDTDFMPQKMPRRFTSEATLRPEDFAQVQSRRIRLALQPGDLLRWGDIETEAGSENQLSFLVPAGFRAYSLRASNAESIRPYLAEGDRLDIYGSFRGFGRLRETTRTLFQNISVVRTRPDILVLLTPAQVELLTFADQQGQLGISLRNRDDTKTVDRLPEVAFRDFLSLEAPQGPVRERSIGPGPQVLTFPSNGKKRS